MLCPRCGNKISNNSKVCNFCNYTLDDNPNNIIEVAPTNEREAPKSTSSHIYVTISNILILISIFIPCLVNGLLNNIGFLIGCSFISLLIGLIGGYLPIKTDFKKKDLLKRRNVFFVIGLILLIFSVMGGIAFSSKEMIVMESIAIGGISSSIISFLIGTEMHLFLE